MILKFTPEVDVTVDESNSSVANVALSEISTNMKIAYEVWLDTNENRIKSLTAIVPAQTLNFKNKINDVWYNVILTVTDVDTEGLSAGDLEAGAQPYELELSVDELTVLKDEQTIHVKATGLLFFD